MYTLNLCEIDADFRARLGRARCCIKLRQMLFIRETIAYKYHEVIRCVGELYYRSTEDF